METDVGVSGDFGVLGHDLFDAPPQISHAPRWIASAARVSSDVTDVKSGLDLTDAGRKCDWLHSDLLDALRAHGIKRLFPIQKSVVPKLVEDLSDAEDPHKFILLESKIVEGSGKTLCYVLPILSCMLRRRNRPNFAGCIQAIIVVPSHELAEQVYNVLRAYCGTLFGENGVSRVVHLSPKRELSSERGLLWKETARGWCCVGADVIVTNVSRLLDHLLFVPSVGADGEPHSLDLRNLRMDWLAELENAVYNYVLKTSDSSLLPPFHTNPRLPTVTRLTQVSSAPGCKPFQKVLLSATLGRDPELLQQWRLFRPRMFLADRQDSHTTLDKTADEVMDTSNILEESMNVSQTPLEGTVAVLPAQLKQQVMVVESKLKPLAVFVLLQHTKSLKRVLCFTGSRESTDRLCYVLGALHESVIGRKLADGPKIVESITSGLLPAHRRKILRRFTTGATSDSWPRVLVCTDLVSRGVDLPNVDLVLNYDKPKNAVVYAHRAGRTARMGHEGTVCTLVHAETEISDLHQILNSGGLRSDLHEQQLDQSALATYMPNYKKALASLAEQAKSKKKKVYRGKRKK